jgi:hypothetical protein
MGLRDGSTPGPGVRRRWGASLLVAVLAVGLPSGLSVLSASAAVAPRPLLTSGESTGSLLATFQDPAATNTDRFGYSVAVSGTTAIVGAPGFNSFAGAAYIYTEGPAGWPTTPSVTLPDPGNRSFDDFGKAVAIRGSAVIVGGSQVAYIYAEGAVVWPTTPSVTIQSGAAAFGTTVAISGTAAIVGAEYQNSSTGQEQAGSAYIYTKGKKNWQSTPSATLTDPDATSRDFFGYSVSISNAAAVVGAEGVDDSAGAAYIYAKGSAGWPTTPSLTLDNPATTNPYQFGQAVAICGMAAVVGAKQGQGGGPAYIYAKGSTGQPSVALDDPSTTGQDFATAIAMSGDKVVVGDGYNNFVGAAYIYTGGPTSWRTTPKVSLSDPAPADMSGFGSAVAISGDSNFVVVGAPAVYHTATIGTAYLYKS